MKGRKPTQTNLNLLMFNFSWFKSPTHVTLLATIVIALGNALIPFMSSGMAASVTTVLTVIAMLFHVSEVKQAAQSSATLGKPVSGQ